MVFRGGGGLQLHDVNASGAVVLGAGELHRHGARIAQHRSLVGRENRRRSEQRAQEK